MIRGTPLILAVSLGALLLANCRRPDVPIYNTPPQTFATAPASLPQRADQIKMGGSAIGWQMTDLVPGKLRARKEQGKYGATVIIDYTPETFAIVNDGSQSLRQQGGMIHPAYNEWVRELEQAIRQTSMNTTPRS